MSNTKNVIRYGIFDGERAFYGSHGVTVERCNFDGEADGESAFKESCDVTANECYFNLRYPFWHTSGVRLLECKMTDCCRAPLWYSESIDVSYCGILGVKALRECSDARFDFCDIVSAEFGWFSRDVHLNGCKVKSEYFMLHAKDLTVYDTELYESKYSFQYVENATVENCILSTKDAFWHAKNVTVRNCTVRGEYLGWYSENLTFESCTLIGTQPLCYCKGLKLIDCTMEDADLAFERSYVDAEINSRVTSIKNAYGGKIRVRGADQIIRDDENALCVIVTEEKND